MRAIGSLILASFVIQLVFAVPMAHARPWSTGKKVAVGAGAVVGGYLLYRAYERHESRVRAQSYNQGYRQSQYDNDPGNAPEPYYPQSGSNQEYDDWVAQQSQAEQNAAAQKAYDDEMAANAAKFKVLSGQLAGRVQQLKGTQSAWACASLCGEYNGTELIAKVVDSTGRTGEAALAAANAKCTGKAYLFTSIASKSKSYELNFNPGACFVVKTDAAGLVKEVADGKSVQAKMIVVDVEIIAKDTPVSAKFKHEALKGAQDVMKMLDQAGGDTKKAVQDAEDEAAKADPEFMKKLAAVHPIVKLSRPGHVVMSNEETDPANKVEIIADVIGNGAVSEIATVPYTVSHKCGDETHPVKFKIIGLSGPAMKSKAYKPSEHLLGMYQDALFSEDKDGGDSFCASSERGNLVKDVPAIDAVAYSDKGGVHPIR